MAFNTEEDNGSDGEASFDNDVATEDENSDENSEAEATESEDTDVAESEDIDDDEDEEEKPFDETSAHEDEDEDDDKSKLGEEFVPEYKLDEEEVSNAFKSVGGLKEEASENKYAEEA